jgi:hypothetical protein
MKQRDGYGRNDRLARLDLPGTFRMLDNDKTVLLRQLLQVAGWIRFYNEREIPDRYFDSLLPELARAVQAASARHSFDPDGEMEPSQALLLAFVENLGRVLHAYNERWRRFPQWYLDEYLKVASLPVKGDKIWLSFAKTVPEYVSLEKGTPFTVKADGNRELTYLLSDDLDIHDITIAKAFSVCFERNPYQYPAAKLGFVTVIKTRDLLADRVPDRVLLFGNQQNTRENKAIGIRITSPSLLLREGKRVVTVTFEAESDQWHRVLEKAEALLGESELNAGIVRYKLFSNLFFLTLSTEEGWTPVSVYEVRESQEKNKLILRFLLPEEFPSTVACSEETHGYVSGFPALQVRLNYDAWLYGYSWMSEFIIQRISIGAKVEGVTNVQVYNELGKVDSTKSFPPFGIKTGAGAWMAVGNYEMAVKNTLSACVSFKWGQLPVSSHGLRRYYAAYPGNISNASFKVSWRYLSDNKWKAVQGDPRYRLFADEEPTDDSPVYDPPVADEVRFEKIPLGKMAPVELPEEEYEYTVKARSGFLRMTMEAPQMGFGEQAYRDLFTERLLMKKWRKRRLPPLHPPIAPVVEQVAIDYTSKDIIDLRSNTAGSNTVVEQLHPFGVVSTADKKTGGGLPFVFSQQGGASVMFGLKNVRGGETYSFFLVFEALSNELSIDDVPKIVLYWGDGYEWEEVPRGFVERDDTRQMLVSGNIVFRFPAHIPPATYDKDGILWVRAAIMENHALIPELKAIRENVGQLARRTEGDDDSLFQAGRPSGIPAPVYKIPGLGEVSQVTTYYDGRGKESSRDMQARVSEYVTHRGRAVTARDYELLVLQEFPDVGKALCLPGVNMKNDEKGVVTVVVLPQHEMRTTAGSWPLVPSPLLAGIEDFLQARAAAGARVDVVNPVYEELLVKCTLKLKESARLIPLEPVMELLDNFIAPWRKKGILPVFGKPVDLSAMYRALAEMDFIEEVAYFAVIRVSQDNNSQGGRRRFHLHEYDGNEGSLHPDRPYKLFVPGEHIIGISGKDEEDYGLGDMEIDKTFIL